MAINTQNTQNFKVIVPLCKIKVIAIVENFDCLLSSPPVHSKMFWFLIISLYCNHVYEYCDSSSDNIILYHKYF